MTRQFRILLATGAFLLAALLVLSWMTARLGRRPQVLPVLRQTGDFTGTNQLGKTVTSASLRGRPYAVNLIFTRCPGPCRQLSGVMRRVAGSLPPGARSGLVSVTSDPEFDTPEVLAAYGAKFEADPSRWQFVTSGRDAIRKWVTQDLMLVLVEKSEEERDGPDDLFLHSTLIVILDAQGRVRTAFEGLEPDVVDRVTAALVQLEKEAEP